MILNEIDMLDVDSPQSNIIEFKKGKREGTLKPVRASYDACKHVNMFVDEATREVSCQKCGTKLDAFSVLFELAHKQRRWLEELDEWDARRESILSERYDQQWERDHEGIAEPPSDPSLRRVWDTFHSVMGDKFCRMYRRNHRKRNGPEWYGVSTEGMRLSYEYARSKMIPKAAGT